MVARTNADLQRVLDAIVSTEGVVRSSTLISLATQVPYRILPLVRAAVSGPTSALIMVGIRRGPGVSCIGSLGLLLCLMRAGRVS